MKIQSLAVFCGSKSGNNPRFAEEAATLGRSLARNGIRIVYGGGSAGLMGIVADAALAQGGHVTGFIPRLLLEWEVEHRGLTELIVCDDMHERKRRIYSKSDAAVILPGGFGTLDELFEIITWNQLTIHDKPIRILNTDGFYDHLSAHMERMRVEGFLYPEAWSRIGILSEAIEVIRSFP
jgi:uncharacterized protein (TIGR00730 family)